MLKKNFSLCVATILALGLTARAAQTPTVADVAVSNADLSTLVAALKEANLLDALKGAGPFTIFAPNNAAFTKFGKPKLDAVMKDKEMLKQVLLYHVLSGKYTAADITKLPNATKTKTINGADVIVKHQNGVQVNNARVLKADILGSNGVIHVIDTVLQPPVSKPKPKQ